MTHTDAQQDWGLETFLPFLIPGPRRDPVPRPPVAGPRDAFPEPGLRGKLAAEEASGRQPRPETPAAIKSSCPTFCTSESC